MKEMSKYGIENCLELASGASRPVELSGEASNAVTRVDRLMDKSKYGIKNLRNSDQAELEV